MIFPPSPSRKPKDAQNNLPPVLLTSAYFPPISYFAALSAAKFVLIEACETYARQTYRNRCRILGSNRRIDLSVPVNQIIGNRTSISKVVPDINQRWKLHHWRSILASYGKAPFFIYYSDELNAELFQQHSTLLDLNNALLRVLIRQLHLETNIQCTVSYRQQFDGTDLREMFHPKRTLLPAELFQPYTQVFSAQFVPDLSILDLLFNEGPESKRYLLALANRLYKYLLDKKD